MRVCVVRVCVCVCVWGGGGGGGLGLGLGLGSVVEIAPRVQIFVCCWSMAQSSIIFICNTHNIMRVFVFTVVCLLK